jgi:hypothetical protein
MSPDLVGVAGFEPATMNSAFTDPTQSRKSPLT